MRRTRASSGVMEQPSSALLPPPPPTRSTDITWLGLAAIVAVTAAAAATTAVVEAVPFHRASISALRPLKILRRKPTQEDVLGRSKQPSRRRNILSRWPIMRQQQAGVGRRHRPTFLVTIPRGGHADFLDDGMYSDSDNNKKGDGAGGNGGDHNMDGAQPGQQQRYDHSQDQLQQYHGYGYDTYQHEQLQQHQLAQAEAEAAQAYLSQVASISRMNSRTASLALRLTVEINQRLRWGTEAPHAYRNSDDASLRHLHMDLLNEKEASEPLSSPPPPPPPPPASQSQLQQQHQSSWQMQPFRQKMQEPQHQNEHEWQPKIKRPDPESEGAYYNSNQHTIFHADMPRTGPSTESLTGVKRWGVELQQYIEEICRAMKCSDEDIPLVLARALIYLDRACSVGTERHNGYHSESSQPCPPLLPRTVHRLVLAAMVLSCRIGRGQGGVEYDGAYCEMSTQFGVPSNSLATMEAIMRDALGMEGLWIDFPKLVHYLSAWRQTFTEEGADGCLSSSDLGATIMDTDNNSDLPHPSSPEDIMDNGDLSQASPPEDVEDLDDS